MEHQERRIEFPNGMERIVVIRPGSVKECVEPLRSGTFLIINLAIFSGNVPFSDAA